MTQTPNIGLKKIDGSENWRNVFDYHNDSMDLADEAFAGVRAGLTYVENGDTIAANANYTAGKFIAWKGEIYRVKATINTTVTSGNWTTYLDKMDGMGGALSQINDDLTSLNSNISSLIVSESIDFSNSESIPANSVKRFEIPIGKTGYTPVGIAWITGSGTTGLVLQEYMITETKNYAWIYYRNALNTAITPSKITVRVLYAKNIA